MRLLETRARLAGVVLSLQTAFSPAAIVCGPGELHGEPEPAGGGARESVIEVWHEPPCAIGCCPPGFGGERLSVWTSAGTSRVFMLDAAVRGGFRG